MKSGVLVGLAALLTGCGLFGGGGDSDGEKSPSPANTAKVEKLDPDTWRTTMVESYESVKVPAEFLADNRSVSSLTALAATDTLPGIVVAETFLPDERPQVGVWTPGADGTVGEPTVVTIGNYATNPIAVTNGVSSWILGRTYVADEGWGIFLARSEDRQTWDGGFEAELAGWTPLAATLAGDTRMVVIGLNDGRLGGLVITDKGNSEFDLPDADDPEGSSVVGVASDGEQIVVLRQMADAPAVNVTTLGSDDWQTADLPGAGAAAGIVRLPDRYLVAGQSAFDDDYSLYAMAWTSADGVSWEPEAVDPDHAISTPKSDSAERGPSAQVYGMTVSGGRAQAIVGDVFAGNLGVFERGEDGAWRLSANTYDASFDFEQAIPAPRADGGSAVALVQGGALSASKYGSLSFDQVSQGNWAVSPDPHGVYYVRPTFSVRIGKESQLFAAGWARDAKGVVRLSGGLYDVADGALTPVKSDVTGEWMRAWDPPYGAVTSKAGTTVVLGMNEDGDLSTWRYADGQWEGGLVSHDFGTNVGLAPVGKGWNALLGDRVYASADGLSWKNSTELEDFDDSIGTSVDGMCALPGEKSALLLGTHTNYASETEAQRPAAWLGSGDTWRSVTVTDASFGRLSGCATGKDIAVVAGSVATAPGEVGTRSLWTSANGRDWAPVELADGVEIGDPVAVDGGFAATGSVDGESVVWLSDGTTWQWAPAPEEIAVSEVFAMGSDVLLISEFGVPTMTLIPAVADRIAQIASS